MTCPSCNSIWLRPADPAWLTEGDSAWTRRFECGGCGSVFVLRVTRIGKGRSDREKQAAKHSPPEPKSMAGENGGMVA